MGESNFADSALNDPASASADSENVVAGSWMESVASILEELASTGAPVRAAEGASRCPGAQCGSTFNGIGSKALAGILIVLMVAGTLAIRQGRRSRTERAAEDR